MKISEYISKDVDALTLSTTIASIKEQFNGLTYTHIPIVENDELIGLISESDIRTIDEEDETLSSFKYLFSNFFVITEHNWMEILRIFAANETNILPVLTHQGEYLGYYELSDILHFFNDTPLISEEGFFLVIEKGIKDYSLSEVVQIVESTDAKISGVFISGYKNDLVQITLKVTSNNINEVIQSFRRYGYNLLTKHKEDLLLEELKNRSDYLQKYLNL